MSATRKAHGFWVGKRAGEGSPPPPPPFSMQVGRPFASTRYLISVADRAGRLIGELWGQLENVNWRMDGYGQAALQVAPQVARDTPWLLEYGNRVLIEFENGLTPWGGVIDVPRETSALAARVQLYQAAYTLGWGLLAGGSPHSGEWSNTAAAILKAVVAQLRDVDIDIAPGGNGEKGAMVDVTFGPQDSGAAAAARLRELDPQLHYTVETRRAAGRIVFALHVWREARRDDSRRVVLIGGHNFVGATTLEQGPLINAVLTAVPGQVEPWAAVESKSAGRFGRRETWLTPTGVEEWGPNMAYTLAHNQLSETAWPRLRTSGQALDRAPGRFRDYGIGSLVTLEGERPVSLSRPAMVIGMDYTPGSGALALVFDDTEEAR